GTPMTALFRMVHFVPDRFTGARFPIAALVATGGGLRVVSAPHRPGNECLGGPQAGDLLDFVVEALGDVVRIDDVPPAIETCVDFGEVHRVPTGATDPATWVQDAVLTPPRGAGRSRGQNRNTIGREF